ncbi:hypothetical protein PHLGIDRAFT_88220 [Phlebiopsis gigantea 11061_1 CR5-6]|uniref:E3 ubiquitin protein ligase n=1 Tax=Phlebiopsis gigantea (strain 11061_1 CR5-6) TaxID=745531 RepID=A0A0C3S9L3_PHLG1|nr:hypothetical protein PHLGIDRAFT_88220 [Phlebiopsis gigantea 11061_1 CR5-6]
MESRKRPRQEDGENVQSKKRALSTGHDSPVAVNGDADEPKDSDSLEAFRKDAIYRRMKHYARENERSQVRIAELERKRNTCEAGLAALEACWAQLIGTVRSLGNSEKLPAVVVDTRDVLDLTKHVTSEPDSSDYVEQLRSRMYATEQLVAAFVRVGSEARSQLLHDQNTRQCLEAQTECASLRAEVSLLSTKLREAESEKEKYHEQLTAAETRIDRLHSVPVSSLNPSSHSPDGDILKDETQEPSKSEKVNATTTPRRSPSVGTDIAVNGDLPSVDGEEISAVYRLQQEKYDEALQENAILSAELYKATATAKAASETQLTSSAHWKSLTSYMARLCTMVEEDHQDILSLHKDLEALRKVRDDLEHEHQVAIDKMKAEFQEILSKRELEVLRLREQRDAREVELKERKAREFSKIQLTSQYKQLADTREERIIALASEVGRLKARLASDAHDEDLMTFFFKSNEDITYIGDLRKRLEAAETRLQAFEHTDIGEVERKERLFVATKQLERYKAMFGPASTLPPDSKAMAEELQRKELELHNLRLQLTQQEQAETSMYAELERLSSAWEALERDLKSKIYDLSAMDDQLKKLSAEKAKAENKYFKAMSDKAAVEQQNLPYQRKLEKQAKVLEKLTESHRFASNRVKDLERACTTIETLYNDSRIQQESVTNEKLQYRARYDDTHKQLNELNNTFEKALLDLQHKKQDLAKQEEAAVKKKVQFEKQIAKAKATANSHHSSGSGREAELQEEVDKCMSILKCSTCRQNMRNTVLTKCMHSFCKNCVNERISSRQRKCPACNLPFSQGEVQQLYFQ